MEKNGDRISEDASDVKTPIHTYVRTYIHTNYRYRYSIRRLEDVITKATGRTTILHILVQHLQELQLDELIRICVLLGTSNTTRRILFCE
jgi:hypothetical protein